MTQQVGVRNLSHELPSPGKRRLNCVPAVVTAGELAAREVRSELPYTSVDPLEEIFGDISIRDYTSRARVVLAQRPLDNGLDYIEFLLRVLYELMRTYWRAPIPFQVMYVSERLTEYQLANMRASMGIYAINIDPLRNRASDEATFARLLRTISDRLHESFNQWLGYMVLYGRGENLAEIKKLWEPRIIARHMVYTSLLPYIELKLGVNKHQLMKIVALFYGGVKGLEEADTVSQAVLMAEDKYFTMLEVVGNDPFLSMYLRPAVDDEETRQDSAFMHSALKALAIKYLMDIGIDPSAINVESLVANVPIDIRVERGWGSSIAIEAETLYSVGNPVTRLATVIRERLSLGYNVWIVIPPTQALIFAPHIRGLMNHFAERVEFYTVDTSHATLQPLTTYYRGLDSIFKKTNSPEDQETRARSS